MTSVSIVIVSRGRPEALMRCLTGISQLDYPEYEVITVACPAGAARVAARTDALQIKQVTFDTPNISVARNLGIRQAAGEVVAFIDDDAVPEPLWLTHLTAPFDEPDVAAAGGFVLGRNGISFQWQGRSVDGTGQTQPLDLAQSNPTVLTPAEGRAIKTEGTNMAVRRDVLAEMGGFDPAFRFYLDETDLNLRLASAGHATALVPLAQVHHGFAPSARRASDRTPRDLTEIGASQHAFLRKHCPKRQREAAWARFEIEQRNRLLRLMQSGPLGADDVKRLLRGLHRGSADGATREIGVVPRLPRASNGFLPYPGRPDAPRHVLSGHWRKRRELRNQAAAQSASGAIVSLFLFEATARYHHVSFDTLGFWEQRGGRFGRSVRTGPLFKYWRFTKRLEAEIRRVAPVRGDMHR